MNWQSSSRRRQSPPGWCLGRTILGADAGRGARRRGERARWRVVRTSGTRSKASGGGRSDPGAAPRSPPAARAIQWTSEAGRSRALNLDGGLRGLRWAVSQCVGQWEGGRKRGCARLLGGGALLKVQCESGDISHLLETLPNYLLEVPEFKAAEGNRRVLICVGARGRGKTGAGGGGDASGVGSGEEHPLQVLHAAARRQRGRAQGGGCVCEGRGGGAGGGGGRRWGNPGVCLRIAAARLRKDFANAGRAASCRNTPPAVGWERAGPAASPGRAAALGPGNLGAGRGEGSCLGLCVPYFAATLGPEL